MVASASPREMGGMGSSGNGAEQAVQWLAGQREAMLRLLEELVNTDSGSYDKDGVDRAAEVIERFLAAEGIPSTRTAHALYGDAVRASIVGPGGTSNRHVLLLGHRDTVFPKGEPERRPFRVEGERAYGPGVADMKGGLVMNLFVLAAFHRFGGHPAPLVALITSDEEIGSPACRPLIEAEARSALAVFNSEPGRQSGNIVSRRKGGVFMLMRITGKAAHSGANFADGRSAIEAMARKITQLHALIDLERGTTVNVGLVRGGQSVNTVAPWAEGEIDLRYVRTADRERAVTQIRQIVEEVEVEETSGELEIKGEFLPLEPTTESERLLGVYQKSATKLGFRVEGEFTGGCADSGFTAAMGAPTLCAVGPIGGKGHSPDEYMLIDSLVLRAQAAALTIARLGG
jgi:glutamate carboxypeptidase